MPRHSKAYVVNPRLSTAIAVSATTVTLNTKFVAAVKVAYVNGNLRHRSPKEIVAAVAAALRSQTELRLTWDDVAIDVALRYLGEKGDIVLPSEKLASVA